MEKGNNSKLQPVTLLSRGCIHCFLLINKTNTVLQYMNNVRTEPKLQHSKNPITQSTRKEAEISREIKRLLKKNVFRQTSTDSQTKPFSMIS